MKIFKLTTILERAIKIRLSQKMKWKKLTGIDRVDYEEILLDQGIAKEGTKANQL